MKKILFIALTFLATVGIAKATLWDFYQGNLPTVEERQPEAKSCGLEGYSGQYDQNVLLEKCLRSGSNSGELSLGGTLPVAGSTYSLAGSGISSSASSITLQSFTIPQSGQKILDSDLSDTFYATLEPGSRTRQEIVACTTVTQNSGGTATFSGCSRGMAPIYPYTASSTLAFVHAGGSQVILSDPPQLFNEYPGKANTETVTGIWTFNNLPKAASVTTLATTSDQLATKYYVDNVGAGGFTAANVGTNYGLKALGTSPETVGIDLASLSGLRFDNAYDLQVATSSASGITVGSDGAIKVATTTAFIWAGTDTHFTGPVYASSTFQVTGNTTLTGHSTTTGSMTVGGTLATGDDGFISKVTAGNEAVITVPTGARRAIIYISGDTSCNTDIAGEITLTYPGKTTGYFQPIATAYLVATSTNWTTIGYNTVGDNCVDGADAEAYFYRY